MSATAYCSQCGNELGQNAAFCPSCGLPTGNAAPAHGSVPPVGQAEATPQPTQAMPELVTDGGVLPTQAMPAAGGRVAPYQRPQQNAAQASAEVASPQAEAEAAVEAAMQAKAPAAIPPETPSSAGRRKKGMAMTVMAGQAFGMSQSFNAAFGNPFPGWRAELAEPVGPSTGGGRQAQQPITIMATNGDRLAIGRVDSVKRLVTLKTHAAIAGIHFQRYGRSFMVSPHDFERYIGQVSAMFSGVGYMVSQDVQGVDLRGQPDEDSGSGRIVLILLALLVLAGIGALLYTQL